MIGRITVFALWAAAAAAAASGEAMTYFRSGLEAIRRGAFTEAETAIREGLRLDPSSPAGYDLLGIACGRQGRDADAERAFGEALRLNPRFVPAHNDLAASLYRRGRVEEASREFEMALAIDGRNFTANYNLGIIARERQDHSAAIRYLDAALEAQPSDGAALLALTGALLGAGDSGRALNTARRLEALAPGDARVHFSLGTLFMEWKHYPEAAEQFEQARVAEPDNFELLHNLGQAYSRLGKHTEAEAVFLKALSVKPESVETLYQLAVVYSQSGHADQAIQVLVRARQVEPRRPDVLLLLGRNAMEEGFLDDAVEVLESGVSLDAQKIEPHMMLGEAYTRKKQYDKALEQYEAVRKLQPRDPQAWVSIGRTLQYMRRGAEAEQVLKSTLELDPKNAQAAYYMGVIAADRTDYDEAERWYRQALSADPRYLGALYDMAITCIRREDYARARDYLEKAIAVSPKFAQLYYRLSTVYRRLKQPDKAEQAFAAFKKYEQADEYRRNYYPHGVLEFVKETQDLPEPQKLERYRQQLLRAAQMKPDDLNVMFMLAQISFRMGQAREGLSTLEKIAAARPDDARAAMRAASLLTAFAMYPDATSRLNSFLDRHPEADDVRFALAALLHKLRRDRDALKLLSAARVGQTAAWHNLLGRVLLEAGDAGRSTRELQDAVAAEPENQTFALDLIANLARRGRSQEAGKALESAQRKWPASAKIRFAQALLSAGSGRGAEARVLLQRAAGVSTDWRTPYVAEAVMAHAAGEDGRAAELAEQAVRLFPGDPWARWARMLGGRGDSAASAREFDAAINAAPTAPESFPVLLETVANLGDCIRAERIAEQMRAFGMTAEMVRCSAGVRAAPQSDFLLASLWKMSEGDAQ
jgi:tetratricopeptide (TPR) repeat protein